MHLLNELGPQILQWDVGQVLELVLLGEWPDHGAAVSFFEERLQKSADPIFLVDCLAESLLALKRLLEVVLRGNGLLLCVDQLQGEVADHPHERWEVGRVLLWVGVVLATSSLDLDVLGQIDHQ